MKISFLQLWSLLLVLYTYSNSYAQSESLADQAQTNAATATALDELRSFSDALDVIRAFYVEPLDETELIRAAIDGMTDTMDQYSAWLPAERFSTLATDAAGSFGGIGANFAIESGFVRVIEVLNDSPAALANIEIGDRIIAIDGESLRGQNLSQAINSLRGPVGTNINLRLRRSSQILDKKVSRAKQDIASVVVQYLPKGILYLSIEQFSQTTKRQLKQHLQSWLGNSPESTGIILDLRNNPGGTVEAAVAVADAFIDQGLLVSAQGRNTDSSFSFDASEETLTDLPLTVLINEGTASASEILAGALQDHQRAVIIGEQSFGKGSVQNIIPLPNGSAVRLTTARYQTPSGRSIDRVGITPDIKLSRQETNSEKAIEVATQQILEGPVS